MTGKLAQIVSTPSIRELKHDASANHGGHVNETNMFNSHIRLTDAPRFSELLQDTDSASGTNLQQDTRDDHIPDFSLMATDGKQGELLVDPRDDPISVLSLLAVDDRVEKFDSGASRCMTGNPSRHSDLRPVTRPVRILGFNSSGSTPSHIGLNHDGKEEYYVSDMPEHLTLLCANAYCQDGCAVLFADGGLVLKMTAGELEGLKAFLKSYPVQKVLRVNNRTYEVDHKPYAIPQLEVEHVNLSMTLEEALQGTATRFFNTKVNVSNQEERILTLLMTGLTFRDWQTHLQHGSLRGIPKDLTTHGMNQFEYRYGRTPDIVQLANPRSVRDATGLRDGPAALTHCGQRIEIDCMFSDYNIRETVPGTSTSGQTVRTKKLPTHGGAIAAAVCVDCYSSFVHGKLLKGVGNPEEFVEYFFARYKRDNWPVSGFAADQGIITNSMFHVTTTEVDKLCARWNVQHVERAEPYNHARITGSVEIEIQLIKQLIRLAIVLILRNPNFPILGFTPLAIFKLWGELFHWAVIVVNLKSCPKVPDKSRWEVFYGIVPNMQDIRLLPIGCILIVIRIPTTERDGGTAQAGGVIINEQYGQVDIYVGPSLLTPGAARVAVMSNGRLKILVTSNFRSGSDGGGLNIYPHIERGLKRLLDDQIATGVTTEVEEEPETEVPFVYDKPTMVAEQTKATDSIADAGDKGVKRGRRRKPTRKFELSVVDEKSKRTKSMCRSTQESNEPFSAPTQESTEPFSAPTGPPTNKPTDPEVKVLIVEPTEAPATSDQGPQPKRSQRIRERRQRRIELGGVATDTADLETACFADWSEHDETCYYWSWTDFAFVQIKDDGDAPKNDYVEEGYRAVTVDVPKSFEAALVHPRWSAASQKEMNTILSARAMVQVNAEVAREAIRNEHADLMYLFPVYEEKLKEGVLVEKVRLVADGRTHNHAGQTYSATPSREELLILMHIIAALDWDYAHVDEVRAFLSAPYKGQRRAFVKFRGGKDYYEVLGALYGLKTAPRHYQEAVAERLESLGFKRLVMCSCIYLMMRGDDIVIIYDYVDDFIFTGNSRAVTERVIQEFRQIAQTTEPIWDAEKVLGMEFKRDRKKRIILITMTSKIEDVSSKLQIDASIEKRIPMPQSGYIIKDHEFESMRNQDDAQLMDKAGIANYMTVVGGLIWISGLRLDILFATLYLAWSTRAPRYHHMRMARHVLSYLYTTKDLPLVLGGSSELEVITYTDASLGTAPKGRSIVANMTKLSQNAGAVSASSKATNVVFTSSFEAELDGVTRGLKANSRTVNILKELRMVLNKVPHLWSDNLAMVKFVQGEGVAKGIRHVELRMWYVRERYKDGTVVIDWMTGQEIPADKLTKLGTREEHEVFTWNIMGHALL